eukprot:7178966-Alexandrium_andersonii.AAC.1
MLEIGGETHRRGRALILSSGSSESIRSAAGGWRTAHPSRAPSARTCIALLSLHCWLALARRVVARPGRAQCCASSSGGCSGDPLALRGPVDGRTAVALPLREVRGRHHHGGGRSASTGSSWAR